VTVITKDSDANPKARGFNGVEYLAIS
jgi:hypothetical protein